MNDSSKLNKKDEEKLCNSSDNLCKVPEETKLSTHCYTIKYKENQLSYEKNFEYSYKNILSYKKYINTIFGISSIETSIKKSKKNLLSDNWTNYTISKKKCTSKTDLIIYCNEKKYKISLKKNKGRFTSCGRDEFETLIRSVINNNSKYKNNIILNRLSDDLIDNMPNMKINDGKLETAKENTFTKLKEYFETGSDYDKECFINKYPNEYEWFIKTRKSVTICNSIYNDIYKYNYDFIEDIMTECLRGYYKFNNNDGTSDFLLIIDKNGNVSNLIDMNNDIINLKEYIKNNTINLPFAIKSSSSNKKRTQWVRFL